MITFFALVSPVNGSWEEQRKWVLSCVLANGKGGCSKPLASSSTWFCKHRRDKKIEWRGVTEREPQVQRSWAGCGVCVNPSFYCGMCGALDRWMAVVLWDKESAHGKGSLSGYWEMFGSLEGLVSSELRYAIQCRVSALRHTAVLGLTSGRLVASLAFVRKWCCASSPWETYWFRTWGIFGKARLTIQWLGLTA